MFKHARRVLTVAAVAGALLAVPVAAQAATGHRCHGDIHQVSGHNRGFLNGTQIAVPIDLDVNLSHNALGLLGNAWSDGDDYHGCWHRPRHHRHHHWHHHRG